MKDKLRNETETAFNLLQKGKKFVKSGLKIWPDPNSKSHHLRLLLLILIVLASTYLLIPRPTLPLSLMDVMEVGEIIDRDIKATRDYYIEDRQATNEKIQQAEEKIVDVYDFNLDIQDMAIKNIHRAFSPWQNYYINKDKLQAQIQEINENLAVVVKPRRGKLVEKEGEKLLSAEKYQELLKERQDNLKALEGSLALRKKEAVNYLQIKEAQFQKLAWQKFSIKMEQALVSLVRVAYRFMVLGNVTNVSEGEDSLILIRPISNYEPAGKEYQVKPKTILTITDVRRILTKEYTSLLTDIPQNEQRLILKIALNLLSPNLHFNRGETQWRRYLTRKKITPVIIPIKKGEMIIRDGEKIEQRHLLLLKGMIQESRDYNILLITLGLLGLFALLFWSSFHFGSEHVKKFKHNLKDTFLLTITFLFFLLFCKVSKEVVDALKDKFSYIPLAAYYYGIPLAAGAMAIRLLLNSETVIIFSIVLSIFAGLMFEHNIYYSLYFLVSCLVA